MWIRYELGCAIVINMKRAFKVCLKTLPVTYWPIHFWDIIWLSLDTIFIRVGQMLELAMYYGILGKERDTSLGFWVKFNLQQNGHHLNVLLMLITMVKSWKIMHCSLWLSANFGKNTTDIKTTVWTSFESSYHSGTIQASISFIIINPVTLPIQPYSHFLLLHLIFMSHSPSSLFL